MRWTPGGDSEDLEDRRSEGGGGLGFGGGGGMRIGLGGLLVLGVLSLIFRRDLISPFLGVSDERPAAVATDPRRNAVEEPLVKFVSFVLDDNQKTWEQLLAQAVAGRNGALGG